VSDQGGGGDSETWWRVLRNGPRTATAGRTHPFQPVGASGTVMWIGLLSRGGERKDVAGAVGMTATGERVAKSASVAQPDPPISVQKCAAPTMPWLF
jgi:hypothetical protein